MKNTAEFYLLQLKIHYIICNICVVLIFTDIVLCHINELLQGCIVQTGIDFGCLQCHSALGLKSEKIALIKHSISTHIMGMVLKTKRETSKRQILNLTICWPTLLCWRDDQSTLHITIALSSPSSFMCLKKHDSLYLVQLV